MELETPFPYQLVGADFLASKAQALLADVMGLGKSAQAVRAADLIGARDVLVLCPASVRINWLREFTRFSPFDRPAAAVLTGKDGVPTSGVVVCSYDLLATEKVRKALMAVSWDVLVLDEAHYLKERGAKRTKAVYGYNARTPGLASQARHVWRLSGTPAPNDASELWTHLKSAGIVQDQYWDFVYEFCTGFNSDYGFRITGHRNTDKLKQLLAQFMLRRTKEEVMTELPPIAFHEVTVERSAVELDPVFYEQTRLKTPDQFFAELKLADNTLRQALKTVSGAKTPGQDKLKILEAMAGSMVTLRRYIGMAKLPKVCEMLDSELAMGLIDKIVIFAVHKDVIEHTRQRLAKYGAVTLYGGTAPDKRQKNIDRFMTDPKCRVFIGNIVAAGTGITLTSAHEVAFMEADWVPANNAQAAMRCHRIGQTNPVRVRFFSCEGSVDEEIMTTLRRKTAELAKIF
ncbi:helicase domain-containing protein [Burkholderia lata]|uniref:Helicase domain-containing protein n=1 Tax=Burkholderia lata (strain ATCC 17760 / DSM 23089 / LMG 22485 / NCIMB 9086 / R18194 / 383) TaxID=482957 RepID=A0A6P2WIQ8_BURL3|nr:DEAD/DEAH box helicase [Burkholderia lata]VWC95632.1 helicase domain-containing protein [Burkholderia lata]